MAKKTSKKKPETLASASKAKQLALLRDFNKALKKHAVSGTVAEFQIRSAAAAGDCPAGTVRREVCRKLPNGTVVCEMKCMPA
jgi:hypothetical protein